MTPRIVSLLPSATEIVCSLGMQDALVGRSHECDFPAGIGALPVLTAPKVRTAGSSQEIHDSVESVLREDVSVYHVDAVLLRDLRPTHVVTQVQCDVCAVSLRDVENAFADWTDARAPRIVALNPSTLEDVYADIRRTACALEDPGAGERLVAEMRRRISDVESRSRALGRPRVAAIEWMSPLMVAGNWMPELIEAAGGTSVLASAGRHSPWTPWPALQEADPDVILLLPCGFSMDRTGSDLPLLEAQPEWQSLRAVREGSVFITDGNQFFNRPGPRLADSVEIIAEILHPDVFAFGHEAHFAAARSRI